MTLSIRRAALPFVLLGSFALNASLADAQYAAVRSAYERVRSTAGGINIDRDRSDLLAPARQIYEDCGTMMDRLENCGRELAETGRNFGDERGRIRRSAQTLRGQAEATRKAADYWVRRLDSQDNFKTEYETLRSQLANLEREWSELTRSVEDTRRWVREGLSNATTTRDRLNADCRPIADAQNQAWARFQEAQRNENARDAEHDRLVERLVGIETRENEACSRYIEAYASGRRTTEEVWALRQQWQRALDEQRETAGGCYTAFQALQAAREETGRAYAQLAQTQRELAAWASGTRANEAVEQYNAFVRWNEIFARDFGS